MVDELIKDYKKPEDLIGESGLLKQLTKALVGAGDKVRADASPRLRQERGRCGEGHQPWVWNQPQDLEGRFPGVRIRRAAGSESTFEPRPSWRRIRRRLTGFDDKVLSMYSRGMTTREIQGHLEEMYGSEPGWLISRPAGRAHFHPVHFLQMPLNLASCHAA